MKIPLHIAEKLLLLSNGESITDSSARHDIINELVSEGIINRNGRIKKKLKLQNSGSLHTYLQNHYEINDLSMYIEVGKKDIVTRAELVSAASDSKLKQVRTFKGFLLNSYAPISATFNNEPFTMHHKEGLFNFMYDFERYIPSSDITIVGVENPENFRFIEKQKYLFKDITPLFVSRYPQNQSKDMIKWLQSIPNKYLHFGDFDFAGIGIYIHEFKKHLNSRANFFIPQDIDNLIKRFGSMERYNLQKVNFDNAKIKEENLLKLIGLIHKYKKGLDQEILIKHTND